MRARNTTALLLLTVLGGASACKTAPTQTQVIVLIDAEHGVRTRTAQLQVDVYSEDDAKKATSRKLTPKWPVELALAPKDGDASRSYRVSAEALDTDGEIVAIARLVSSYVEGEKRFVVLQLEDACVDRPTRAKTRPTRVTKARAWLRRWIRSTSGRAGRTRRWRAIRFSNT